MRLPVGEPPGTSFLVLPVLPDAHRLLNGCLRLLNLWRWAQDGRTCVPLPGSLRRQEKEIKWMKGGGVSPGNPAPLDMGNQVAYLKLMQTTATRPGSKRRRLAITGGSDVGDRVLSLTLLLVLTSLNGAIPVLDMVVGDGGAAVEAKHHPSTHGPPHNHLICIQQHANHWAPTNDPTVPPKGETVRVQPPFDTPHSAGAGQLSLPRSRAPPPA